MHICGYITWRVFVNQIWLAPGRNILWICDGIHLCKSIGKSAHLKKYLILPGAGRADLQYTTATGAFTVPSSSATSALALEFHTLAGRFSHRAPSVSIIYMFHLSTAGYRCSSFQWPIVVMRMHYDKYGPDGMLTIGSSTADLIGNIQTHNCIVIQYMRLSLALASLCA